MYKIFYDRNGKVSSVHRESDGAQLAFNPETKIFNETDPLVIELRGWEAENGELDLSDKAKEKPTIADVRENKQQEIIDAAYDAQNELVAGYAPAEQTSWDKKLIEAAAISHSQNLADAPILQAEAEIMSGATTQEDLLNATLFLAGEIQQKSQQLYVASAQIAGKRTLLWNKVEAATTIEEIEAIAWGRTRGLRFPQTREMSV